MCSCREGFSEVVGVSLWVGVGVCVCMCERERERERGIDLS